MSDLGFGYISREDGDLAFGRRLSVITDLESFLGPVGHHPPPALHELNALTEEIKRGGRQLREPLLRRKRVSLPEWLTERSDKALGSARASGGACCTWRQPCQATSGQTVQSARVGRRSERPLASDAVVTRPRASDAPARTHSKLLAGEDEPAAILSSRALASRKKQHPRLRWPRLAAQPGASSGQVLPPLRLPTIGQSSRSDSDSDGEQKLGRQRRVPLECYGPVVIPEGSLFHNPNVDEESLRLLWPAWPRPRHSQWGHHDYAGVGPSTFAINLPDQDGRGHEYSQHFGAFDVNEKTPVFVSRRAAHQDVIVGATATERPVRARHTPIGQADPNAISSQEDVPSIDRVDRWRKRQAPVSSVLARKAREGVAGEEETVSGTLLDFGQWGLDDDYMASLLNAITGDLSEIQSINLSENRLTNVGVQSLLSISSSLKKLKALNLAQNRLGECSGETVAELMLRTRRSLIELELRDNLIGDRACAELCDALGTSPSIAYLGLAGNALGGTDVAGEAIGQMLGHVRSLHSLDLHWNRLRGNGAVDFFKGLYDNNCNVGGKLRRLDLSWNMLGEEAKGGSSRMAKVLSSVFFEGEVLFHLDLSYNGISSRDCRILADGLRSNHTLFGIHLIGNEATVDDHGFIVPFKPKNGSMSSKSEPPARDAAQQSELNDLVRGVPLLLHFMVEDRSDRRPLSLRDSAVWPNVERDVGCCWVCDNWVQQEVSYVPGWSGSEADPDEVTSVFAFFSIDSFARATPLSRTEAPFTKKIFETPPDANHAMAVMRRKNIKRTANGRVVRWVGTRMLPLSSQPVEVIFQVNGRLVAARDLPKKNLKVPKTLVLANGGAEYTKPATPPLRPTVAEGGTIGRRDSLEACQTREVNLVTPAITALSSFRQGAWKPVAVLEHPERRGEAIVLPRKIIEHGEVIEREAWSLEQSTFADYQMDTPELIAKCFDHDWALSKLPQWNKTSSAAHELAEVLRPCYLQLATAFSHSSFQKFNSTEWAAGLTMSDLRGVMDKCDPSGEWLFKGASDFRPSDVDTVFVVSNVLRKDAPKSQLKAMPEKLLARFQFLEALVRVAVRRFEDAGEQTGAAAAVAWFLEQSSLGLEHAQQRKDLQRHLFCEECDIIFWENRPLLDAVYDTYRTKLCYAGRQEQCLTFGAWMLLCHDSEMSDAGFMPRTFSSAFALGRQLHVQDVESFRHMELSPHEFRVALGALVFLKKDSELAFFGDTLADLVAENLAGALKRAAFFSAANAPMLRMSIVDPDMVPVLELVMMTFRDADEDNSGTISVREFRRWYMQPTFLAELDNLGIGREDFEVLHRQISRAGAPELSVDDLCHEFAKMRLQMRQLERAIAYFRKSFYLADKDGSGSLDLNEFREMLSEKGALKKLSAMGITTDEVDGLYEEILEEATKGTAKAHGITVDQLVAGFIRMRDPTLVGDRAMSFLSLVFRQADTDGDGTLSRAEVKRTLCSDKVTVKLKQMGLSAPDWLQIYDQLDTDGDGVLSWDELRQGMSALWAAEVEQNVQRQVTKFVDQNVHRNFLGIGDSDDQARGSSRGNAPSATPASRASVSHPGSSSARLGNALRRR